MQGKDRARMTYIIRSRSCYSASVSLRSVISQVLFERMKWDENTYSAWASKVVSWQVVPSTQDPGYLLWANVFIWAGKGCWTSALCFLERGLWYMHFEGRVKPGKQVPKPCDNQMCWKTSSKTSPSGRTQLNALMQTFSTTACSLLGEMEIDLQLWGIILLLLSSVWGYWIWLPAWG